MSADLEQALAQGIRDGKVPHAVIYATNKDGSFTYKHAAGFLHFGKDDELVQEDSLFMLASSTKVITAVAALKAVELGFFSLDEDVAPHLPELGGLQVLYGFDESDNPILKDRTTPITVRQLLSHTSGLSYGLHSHITKYQNIVGKASPLVATDPTILERYNTPLAYEPGTSWSYSAGLDWTGVLLHRLTGLTLEEFEKKYFWEPLGITGLTFWPAEEWKKSKIPQLTIRGANGELEAFDGSTVNSNSKDCFGGHGMYACMGDYLKVLHSLLRNDGKLITPESVNELFKPQLSAVSQAALEDYVAHLHPTIPGEWNLAIPLNYALGGILFMEDDEGRRKKGTMSWGGLFNPFWIIDRESELAFCFATQVLPPGDQGCKEMTGVAEKAIYKMAGKA